MAGAHDGAQVLAQRAGLAVRAAVGVDDLDAQALDQPAQPQHGGRRVGGFEVDARLPASARAPPSASRCRAARRWPRHVLALSHCACSRTRNSMPPRWGAGQGVQDMHEGRKRGRARLAEGQSGWKRWRRRGVAHGPRAASGRVDGAGARPWSHARGVAASCRPGSGAWQDSRGFSGMPAARGPSSRLTGAACALARRGAARSASLRAAGDGSGASTARHASPARYSPTPNDAWAIRLRSRATGDWASWMRRCPRPCRAAG